MRTEDGYVISKCLNGEPEAFGFLIDKYKGSVYAFAYSKLRNFHDAEDVTQEVFIKAYGKLRSLRRWDNFLAWLYAITSNMCKNWIRFKANRPDSEFVEDQSAGILMQPSLSSYREDRINETLREALDSLPETQRQVLTLHYLGGMNGKEIARFLGISPGAVWERLSRARAQLREEMLEIMSTTFAAQKLQAGFTMRMVEIVKRIKIHPMPRIAGLPWGMSLAAGIIIAILGIGTHLNLTTTEFYTSISSLSGESRALDIGELPVDVMKMPDVTITSIQQLAGNGLGNVVPDIENALFMAPQAEGGTWARKADMPTARAWLSASTADGKIYAIGGYSGGTTLSTVEEYDPAANEWTRKADMPTARFGLSTSMVNGKIYAIGGAERFTGTVGLPTVEEYDPVTNKWTRKADMPTPRYQLSVSAVNGKIYAIGGHSRGTTFSTVEEYDPVTDKWTQKADMQTPRNSFGTSIADGMVYAIGGVDMEKLSIVEEYNPVTDTWSRRVDMPTGRFSLSTCTVNEKIYAIGGCDEQILSTVEKYDPVADKWTKEADMPTARAVFSNSVMNGKIYAIGGTNDEDEDRNGLSTVEEYEIGFSGVDFRGKLPTTWGEVRTALSK